MDAAVHPSGASSEPTSPGSPVRMCLGCRKRDGQAALLRVVVGRISPGSRPGKDSDQDWVLDLDPQRRRPGRGASVHPRPECITQAIRRRAFGPALRRRGQVDTSALDGLLTPQA